jgi:hypothetical protein
MISNSSSKNLSSNHKREKLKQDEQTVLNFLIGNRKLSENMGGDKLNLKIHNFSNIH